MFDTYAPLVTGGVSAGSMFGLLFWMLATGRLATGRELREKDKRIEKLEEVIDVRDAQLDKVLAEYLPAANSVMKALHNAAGEMSPP